MNLAPKKLLFISISAILYLAALILPSYNYSGRAPDTLPGYECLAGGYNAIDILFCSGNPFPFIAWLSNIPYLAGLIIFIFSAKERGFRIAYSFLFPSLVMSLGSLIVYTKNNEIYSPDIGCFVWIFSILLMWAGALLLKREISGLDFTFTSENKR